MTKILVTMLAFLLTPPAFALCVHGKFAKLRQGPSTGYRLTWEAIQYMPLRKVGEKSGWYRVQDVDGVIHWVKSDLVTSKFECAIIKAQFAHLRSGPGTQYEKLPVSKGDKYLSFKVLKRTGEWVQVEDIEGDTAWVLSKLVWTQ